MVDSRTTLFLLACRHFSPIFTAQAAPSVDATLESAAAPAVAAAEAPAVVAKAAAAAARVSAQEIKEKLVDEDEAATADSSHFGIGRTATQRVS